VKRRITILIICLVGALTLAAPAFAASPSSDAYHGVLGQQFTGGGNTGSGPGSSNGGGGGGGGGGVLGAQSSPSPSQTTSAAGGGGLPFTGYQVGLVLAIGGVLLGTGVAVRKATRA
jgi:hypothetical protein